MGEDDGWMQMEILFRDEAMREITEPAGEPRQRPACCENDHSPWNTIGLYRYEV